MKIKLYTSEWFYNMGLVGIKRILFFMKEKGLNLNDFNYKEYDNYLEFDSALLENFHEYYFEYLLEKYNVAEDQIKRIDRYISYSSKEEKFKDGLNYIKKTVKANNDKIKKINEEIYKAADGIYKSINEIKKYNQLEELKLVCKDYENILRNNIVNEKMTLNKFKSMMSNSFFGQVSFLNVVNTSKSIKEQKEIIFKDYINPILELSNINSCMESKDMENLNKNISTFLNSGNRPKHIEKIYNNINKKIIKKSKSIEEFIDYINDEDNFSTCFLCGEYKSLGNDFNEGDFVPLGVSSDNSRNMFWNFNAVYPLCDICRLVLLCSFAGTTEIYKSYIPEEDKQYYAFVNLDTTFEDLYKSNENFYLNKFKENPFKEFILNIVQTAKERSVWQLQNILYVEFNSNYTSKNCKMNYFNIPKYIAEFFKDKSDILNSIKEERFKAKIVEDIFRNRDLKFSIDEKLRTILHQGYGMSPDCYKAVKIKYYLTRKKGGVKVDKKDDDKRLKFVYMRGLELGNHYRKEKAENKINSIAYRLLNATKSNNKKDFMDTLLRVHMNAEKPVPSIFLDIMSEKELSFDEIAHAFISGLISKEFKKNEGEVVNE